MQTRKAELFPMYFDAPPICMTNDSFVARADCQPGSAPRLKAMKPEAARFGVNPVIDALTSTTRDVAAFLLNSSSTHADEQPSQDVEPDLIY